MVALGPLRRNEDAGPAHGAARLVRVTSGTGTIVCTRCEVADRLVRRMKGLLGRRGLPPGHGLLITPASFAPTFSMRFPIDVVFLDRESRIVRVAHALGPWRIAAARRASAALELPAGAAKACALEPGDTLVLEPAS
jgi:uncharacterized protein